jgi:HK97 family phage portal protein
MGFLDSLRSMLTPLPSGPVDPGMQLMADDVAIEEFLGRVTGVSTTRVYTIPSVSEALGVPAIHRAVALISSTTGTLSVQGFRSGELMDQAPGLIVRPDPYQTPGAFYSGTAANMAKYGEFVWWIASRDGDGQPLSLVIVPLHELRVEENVNNRLLPSYTWGKVTGTRYSAANPRGTFVHVMYPLGDPFQLRGAGPLQLCGAATSVTVEAQAWAANFYGEGGYAREVIKKAGRLDPTLRDPVTYEPDPVNGLSEADILRAQWTSRANNVPRVVDESIDSVTTNQPNPQGAQMLEARQHQAGDAARMFGIAGSLLEYQQPGSSLTYQNLEGEFTKFVRTCLQPLYLEPIEQALSDLLTRSTVARFNVKSFLRADVKTRYEVHGLAIDKGIYGPDYAQREEGILPGDVEFAPVPFSPPAAVPPAIPRAASASVRCPSCNKFLARALGPGSELDCPRCKTTVRSEGVELVPAASAPIELTINMPEPVPDPGLRLVAESFNALTTVLGNREPAHTDVHIDPGAVVVNTAPVEVHAPPVNVTIQPPQQPAEESMEYLEDGRLSRIIRVLQADEGAA